MLSGCLVRFSILSSCKLRRKRGHPLAGLASRLKATCSGRVSPVSNLVNWGKGDREKGTRGKRGQIYFRRINGVGKKGTDLFSAELNPVRARMVAEAVDYPWSSYRTRVTDQSDSDWLDMDPCFVALGDTPERRRIRYMEFMRQAVPSSEIDLIRAALQRGQLTGSARFVDEIERIQGQRVELRGQGRPRRNPGK